MIKSPLSEDLGSSPCLALIAARVPMARCWSHAIGDLCLSVQVTLNRPETKFPRTCMRGGDTVRGGWAVPFCVGHVEQTGYEISEDLHARRWGGPFRSVKFCVGHVEPRPLACAEVCRFPVLFRLRQKTPHAPLSRRFARASP